MDGYPSGVFASSDPAYIDLLELAYASPEVSRGRWILMVQDFLSKQRTATYPQDGWPWPWDDSNISDYAYALHEDGYVVGTSFGSPWWIIDPEAVNGGEPMGPSGDDPDEDEEDYDCFDKKDPRANRDGLGFPQHPNMADFKNVTYGTRSGLIVFGGGGLADPAEIDAAEAAAVQVPAIESAEDVERSWIAYGRPNTLDELKGLVASWSAFNWPDHEEIDSAGSICEEAGEVMRAILKRRSGLRGTPEEWRENARDEIGDTVISLLCLAIDMDLGSLEQIAIDRWMQTSRHMDREKNPQAQGIA